MALNPRVENILRNIDLFDKENLSLLYAPGVSAQPLPNTTISDIEALVNDTKRVLNGLKLKRDLLETLNSTYLVNIDTHLNNFLAQFKPISTLAPNQLTTQHHTCLNQLQALNTNLRQSGIYSILTPIADIPKLEKDLTDLKGQALVIVKEAKDNAEIIRSLIPEATATSLSVALDEIAQKLKIRVNAWLVVVITVLLISALFSWIFLDSNEKKDEAYSLVVLPYSIKLKNNADSLSYFKSHQIKSNIGENKPDNNDTYSLVYWVKRIIVFLPLFYLIVFCIKQYNKERKLLEIYVHKKAIGQTLPAYMKQAEKPEIKDEILLRGATMIFTLPESPDSPVHGSDGIGLDEIKSILDIKEKLQK